MAGISEPDITGQSAIKRKKWPNASNSNAQIGALKNFGEFDLASSDASKNNCEDGDKNSCDGENFIMKCGNCTPGIAQPVRSHKEKLEHAKAFLIIFGVFRPLIALALGAAAFWVASGFKSGSHSMTCSGPKVFASTSVYVEDHSGLTTHQSHHGYSP
jgi:hypothetical protein